MDINLKGFIFGKELKLNKMKNGSKLILEIEDQEIECNESSFISAKKFSKGFKFHESKINNIQKLMDQIGLVCKRYFEPIGEIELTIGRDGSDFIDQKYTILMSQFKFEK